MCHNSLILGCGFKNQSYVSRSTFDYNQVLVLRKEVHIYSIVEPIYLQESFNSIYMCLNQGNKSLMQLVCITTDHVRYQIFTSVFPVHTNILLIENRTANDVRIVYCSKISSSLPNEIYCLINVMCKFQNVQEFITCRQYYYWTMKVTFSFCLSHKVIARLF